MFTDDLSSGINLNASRWKILTQTMPSHPIHVAHKMPNSLLSSFISKDTLIVKNLPKHPLSYANLCYLYGQRYL